MQLAQGWVVMVAAISNLLGRLTSTLVTLELLSRGHRAFPVFETCGELLGRIIRAASSRVMNLLRAHRLYATLLLIIWFN